jgi:pterin-4a-carbinolamine dehydratase
LISNKLDHHPEWKLSNNGLTVDVRLTSHFAGNKVTRLDFELAEAMNE